MRPIKKFTDKEASDFRDQFAMAVIAATGSAGATDYIVKQAYRRADEALIAREENRELIDMPCGCNEKKTNTVNITNTPMKDFEPSKAFEELRQKAGLQPKHKVVRPPNWAIVIALLLVMLVGTGIWNLLETCWKFLLHLY